VSQSQEASEDDDDESIAFESLASGSGPNTENPSLQELTEKIDQRFIQYKIGGSTLSNSNASVLQSMCRSRGLSIEGHKADLAARLVDWVWSIPIAEI